jgi:hypothetical protein
MRFIIIISTVTILKQLHDYTILFVVPQVPWVWYSWGFGDWFYHNLFTAIYLPEMYIS